MALIRLIYTPGPSLTLSSLCPRPVLLEALGQLCELGFQTDLQHFAALQEEGAPSRQEILCALPVAAMSVFYVETREDYEEARRTGLTLSKHFPEMIQVLAGPYAVHFASSLLSDLSALDAIIFDEFSRTLCEGALFFLSDHPRPSERAMLLKNQHTDKWWTRSQAFSPLAPFMAKQEKRNKFLQFYPLSFSRAPSQFYYHDTKRSSRKEKTSREIFEEIKWLHDCHGAVAFHLDAGSVSMAEVEDLARELLSRNLLVLYSLGNVHEAFAGNTARLLLASGCRSIGFRIPTGSQRLLEDYYGLQISISALGNTLRLCRETGLFTALHLTGPCPFDDRHSIAETKRFLEEYQPTGVSLHAPAVVPDSLWFCQSRHFSFAINYKKYQKELDPSRLPLRFSGQWNMRRLSFVQKVITACASRQSILYNTDECEALILRLLGIEGVGASARALDRLSHLLTQRDNAGLSELILKFNQRAAHVLAVDILATAGTGNTAAAR
ncbi:MAG: hypothetical protein GX130_11890 [Candidatus Hydrogenedens sp.]|nr:hypothetical protein [Candidatus Hydrogenedens sp.]